MQSREQDTLTARCLVQPHRGGGASHRGQGLTEGAGPTGTLPANRSALRINKSPCLLDLMIIAREIVWGGICIFNEETYRANCRD